MINKPYRPWYDDTKDYNTNAPSYYDYLANEINLEKVQTDAINDLLVRDVDFQDSDEVHVDKLTDWHSDDNSEHAKITFKAHVISSPSSATQTIDGVDYVTSNGIKVLHDGLYAPDYKKVLEKYSADTNTKFTKVSNDIDTINTKLTYKENKLESPQKTITVSHGAEGTTTTTKVDTNPQKVLEHDNLKVGTKLVKTHTSSSNETTISLDSDFIAQVDKATTDISGKQNVLNATNGVKLNDDTLTLDTIDVFKGDLNSLKSMCWVKPSDGASNLPSNTNGNGILTVTRIGDVVQQTYTLFDNKKTFIRTARNADKSTEQWLPWRTLVDEEGLDTAIKNVNKAYNLQNPNIYNIHYFSKIDTMISGDWGMEFFNDTNSKIYNVKIKVGTIKNAGENSVIAQQNVSDLKSAGVPQDFIDNARNGYVFRAGYYLGDTLRRIAFQLKTNSEGTKVDLSIKYYDGTGNIENTLVVEGHECAPVAVPYNNAVSIEETSEFKPVDDSQTDIEE